MDCSTPGSSLLHYFPSLLKFMSTDWVGYTIYLNLCRPLLFLPSIFPSIISWGLSNELALRIRWPKYWCFSSSTSPSKEYSGLISFRIDWFDLLTVQGTLKESSTAPQLESISFLVLSHHGPTLTSVHDYWKNQSFDYMGICQQSDVSAFII